MIGIDIISIDRFSKLSKEDFFHWDKVFTQSEWEYSFNSSDTARSLAGIFSAKEAVIKAVGDKLIGQFARIQVSHEEGGRPIIKIDDRPQTNIHISISHDQNTAVAVAIQI